MKENFATCFLMSLAVCAGLLVFVLAATGLRQCAGEKDGTPWPDVVRDTVTDTIFIAQPTVRDSVVLGWVEVRAPRVWKTPHGTAQTDTLAAETEDSATVLLPMERKVYADSTYRAVVSGIGPRLDSITVYPRTVTMTRTIPGKPPRHWGFGIQGGLGITPKGIQPYVGLGAYYRIL